MYLAPHHASYRRPSLRTPAPPPKHAAHGANPARLRSHVLFYLASQCLFAAGRTDLLPEAKKLEARALAYLKRSCSYREDGSVMAIAVMGFFYEFGLGGIQQDFHEAEQHYKQAALQSCGLAQVRLSFLKTHGRPNIKIDHAESEKWRELCRVKGESCLRWFLVAAHNNVASAQFCLALSYYNAIAVPSDEKKAFFWCERAAVQGHAGAQNVLGNLYVEGFGCEPDAHMGLRWYVRAAERKEAAAIYNIGTLFERGLALNEDHVQAFEWYSRAAQFGSVNAQNVLGIFHEQGMGVNQHPTRAVYYYRTAALNGHPHAQYNLGRCYHDGFGVTIDNALAVMWFKMGAMQAHSLSLLSMAVCTEAGIGTPRSFKQAISFYRRAAARDSQEAARRLIPISAVNLLPATRALLASSVRGRADSTPNLGWLPIELRIQIIGLLDDTRFLTPAQARRVLAYGADRSTLALAAGGKAARDDFWRTVDAPILRVSCDCATVCQKIKHYITMLETPEQRALYESEE